MSDFVAVESIKNALARCPICTECVNDSSRIPRRMPCCLQAMCEPCLETYCQGRRIIACPLCRQQQHLPGGIKSLPIEVLILRFLDVLKTQRDAVPSCTYCPDKNTAMAKCDTCSIYLCQPCLNAHSRNRMTRLHETTSFEEIRHTWSLRSVRGLRERRRTNSSEFQEKLESIAKIIETLSAKDKNIELSEKTASDEIIACFDDLLQELKNRRAVLLANVASIAKKERNSITRAVESFRKLQRTLQRVPLSEQSSASSKLMLDESPADIGYDRRGIIFTPAGIDQLTAIIGAAGLVQTVTFTPTERLDDSDEAGHLNAITIEAMESPEAETAQTINVISSPRKQTVLKTHASDQVIFLRKDTRDKVIISPHMNYDQNTASHDLIISGPQIRNTIQVCAVHRTGCRIQSSRRILLYPPISGHTGILSLYQVKCNLMLKETIPMKKMIFGVASVSDPTDMAHIQQSVMNIGIGTCHDHEDHSDSICFFVLRVNDNSRLFCGTMIKNQAGKICELNLYILLNKDKKKIYIVDVETKNLLATVSDVTFDRPLWTMMYLGRPDYTDMSAQILSGNQVNVSQDMCQLLSTL